VETLLEVISNLPPHQDAAAVVGPGLQHLDSSALAALMKELGRAGMFKRSVELFDYLRRQTSPEFTHLLDIYTYTTAIAVCSASQQLQRALDLMAEMRSRGITCNVHTYSALMNVCIKCNEVSLVQQVYNQMIQEGCTPNLVTYNTLIDLYVKTGQWQEAIKLLDKLEEEVRGDKGGVEIGGCDVVLGACWKWEGARWL
jgi:pentatricopeptide repeat domain-containing protein 1